MAFRAPLVMFLVGCGTSTSGVDASMDAQLDTASTDAADAAEAGVTPCKVGLPDAGTAAVLCDAGVSCGGTDHCCIDTAPQCKSSCGNLELDWVCDRSAHCGTSEKCCYNLINQDLSTCPGGASPTAPICQPSSATCDAILCQVDSDCATNQTCYAVVLPSANNRTLGVCR